MNIYDKIIKEKAKKFDIAWMLVKAIIKIESNFKSDAVSPAGAKGLMQLMPQTARILHCSDPFNPVQNIEAGTKHFANLLSEVKRKIKDPSEQYKFSLAAYNAGLLYIFEALRSSRTKSFKFSDEWAIANQYLKSATVKGKHCDWQQVVRYVESVRQAFYNYTLEDLSGQLDKSQSKWRSICTALKRLFRKG